MTTEARQRGASGIFVAVILVLLAAGALAILALTRTSSLVERGGRIASQFKTLDDALVQFAVANGRLPCPADPSVNDGSEAGGGAVACSALGRTVPWKTIGARAADAIDPWGQLISYRVYAGGNGLTREGGASMVDCDTSDSGPTVGGLCATAPAARDSGPASFLAGKGLSVTDHGMLRTDVGYVLISHGPTGLGGHTGEGVPRDLPTAGGDERANTQAAGPFVIKAFSPTGTDLLSTAHFDDYLSYKRVEELIRAAGLYARNWPEEAASPGTTSSVTFDQATVDAAVGGPVTPGSSVGQVSVTFLGAVVSGNTNGTTDAELSFDISGGRGGLGVAGGVDRLMDSTANERLVLAFSEGYRKFAVTLNEFGEYGDFNEKFQLRFFSGSTAVGAVWEGKGCKPDGGLASFSADVGALFDTVEIRSVAADHDTDPAQQGLSGFLVSDTKACEDSSAICETSLANAGNTCTLLQL